MKTRYDFKVNIYMFVVWTNFEFFYQQPRIFLDKNVSCSSVGNKIIGREGRGLNWFLFPTKIKCNFNNQNTKPRLTFTLQASPRISRGVLCLVNPTIQLQQLARVQEVQAAQVEGSQSSQLLTVHHHEITDHEAVHY